MSYLSQLCFWFVQRGRSYRRSSWVWPRPWSVRSAVTRMWRLPSCPAVTWSAVWTVPPPWGSAPCVARSSRAQSKPTLLKFQVRIWITCMYRHIIFLRLHGSNLQYEMACIFTIYQNCFNDRGVERSKERLNDKYTMRDSVKDIII